MRDLPTIALIRSTLLLRRNFLCQAFSQQSRPGRLWISLASVLLTGHEEEA